MSHEVIMPALGMAQDTGLLVAWRKKPGDPVVKGEPLFEVETDKATMEVEAQADGFLSAVIAAAGVDVPVGSPIARIVATAAEVDGAAPVPATPPVPVAPAVAKPVAAPAAELRPRISPAMAAGSALPVAGGAAPAGRVLASPKARRLAAEQGLDLARLAAAGHPQPYHAGDLALFATLGAGRFSVLTARVDGAALAALLAKSGPDTDCGRLYAAFAAGSWRAVFGGAGVAVTLIRADGTPEPATDPASARLRLVDLTGTRLSGYVPADGGTTLTLARDGSALMLTLAFGEFDLPFSAATRWIDELAARLADPIRQLL